MTFILRGLLRNKLKWLKFDYTISISAIEDISSMAKFGYK